jgi:hypothetical protein
MMASTMEFEWAGFKKAMVGEGMGYFLVAMAWASSFLVSSISIIEQEHL